MECINDGGGLKKGDSSPWWNNEQNNGAHAFVHCQEHVSPHGYNSLYIYYQPPSLTYSIRYTIATISYIRYATKENKSKKKKKMDIITIKFWRLQGLIVIGLKGTALTTTSRVSTWVQGLRDSWKEDCLLGSWPSRGRDLALDYLTHRYPWDENSSSP